MTKNLCSNVKKIVLITKDWGRNDSKLQLIKAVWKTKYITDCFYEMTRQVNHNAWKVTGKRCE